jgi:hypothetical protein
MISTLDTFSNRDGQFKYDEFYKQIVWTLENATHEWRKQRLTGGCMYVLFFFTFFLT